MKTKFDELMLDDYAVRGYESSRSIFLSWADDMCKDGKQYLRLAFKGKHPGDTYDFKEPRDYVFHYNRIRMIKETPQKANCKGKGPKSAKSKSPSRSKIYYVLEKENSDRTRIIDTTNLNLFHEVLVSLEYELHLQNGKDEPERDSCDYEEWVIDLWNDVRDLLQPFMSEVRSEVGSYYPFSRPLIINGVKYTKLSLMVEDSDDAFGYDTFFIASKDNKHRLCLEYEDPYLCIKVVDKLIAECRKASAASGKDSID